MTTMKTRIIESLVNAGIPEKLITIDVVDSVMALMEGSYTHGYDDGREDAQASHKDFVMKVLHRELKGRMQ